MNLVQGYALNVSGAAFLPQFCATVGGPQWLIYAIAASTLINAAVVRLPPAPKHLLPLTPSSYSHLG